MLAEERSWIAKMKTWYDRKAQQHSLILILVTKFWFCYPFQGMHLLQAKYSKPYSIEKKINDLNYVVGTPDKWKEKWGCHINMIRLYQARDQEPQRTLCNAVCTVTAGNKEVMETGPRLSHSKF